MGLTPNMSAGILLDDCVRVQKLVLGGGSLFGLLNEVDGLVRERDESDGENGIGRGAIESQRTTETRPETSGAGTLSWRGGYTI